MWWRAKKTPAKSVPLRLTVTIPAARASNCRSQEFVTALSTRQELFRSGIDTLLCLASTSRTPDINSNRRGFDFTTNSQLSDSARSNARRVYPEIEEPLSGTMSGAEIRGLADCRSTFPLIDETLRSDRPTLSACRPSRGPGDDVCSIPVGRIAVLTHRNNTRITFVIR